MLPDTGPYDSFILCFLRNLHTVLHSGCSNFHPHQQCRKVPSSHSLRIFLVGFFDDGPSDWFDVIPRWSLALHFSDNERCWAFSMCLLAGCVWKSLSCPVRSGSWTLRRLSIDSVQFSHSVVSNSLPPYGLQHARLPCPSPAPRAYSNSCSLNQWCHPTSSSSVIHFFLLQ